MHESHDPLEHVWKTLKADTAELAGNPLLENRLMIEMNKPRAKRSVWRKLAIAAGLLLGCMVLGGGIAAAAGYNPFKSLYIFIGNDGKPVITDEHGNSVHAELVNIDVKDANGQKEVTVRFNPGEQGGTVTLKPTEQPKK